MRTLGNLKDAIVVDANFSHYVGGMIIADNSFAYFD